MPDSGLERFKKIYTDFGEFCRVRGETSEEDTRANILDRLLHEVLGWPRECVFREVFANPGFLDYELSVGRVALVMEAKRSGKSFAFPYKKTAPLRLKISGSLTTNKDIRSAIEQTQRYCSDKGIRFGVTSNGYSFIIFRAILEGIAWRDTEAIIFRSPKEIEAKFTEFWNLLSYSAVSDDLLGEAFRLTASAGREHHRPVEMILDSDAPYARNPLNVTLRPYVDKFFGDIASQNDVKILEHCYVHSRPVQIIDKSLKLAIRDYLPGFAPSATQLETSEESQGGQIESCVRTALQQKDTAGMVVLLMGGIGSGKSTFLRRFFKVVIPDLIKPSGPVIDILLDFLGAPDSEEELRKFLWDHLAAILRERNPVLVQRKALEEMFEKRLSLLKEVYSAEADRLAQKIPDELHRLASNDEEFSVAALNYSISQGELPVIVFDNVDQLALRAQIQIFTFAQRLAREKCCMAILVLREESYCAAQMQKHLTAYTIRPYHLSSPNFRKLIGTRIDFASNAAASEQRENLMTAAGRERQQVIDFFRLLRKSIFEKNKNIVRLVESVSFGNARIALDLLNAFITSGATNMSKILDKFNQYGGYTVPFHEFAKSIILGDYRYYKESRSFIMNVFDVTDKRNASHFTSLRVLRYLSRGHGAARDKEGFTSLQQLVAAIVDIFDNEQDCLLTINELISLGRQLIELDTRRTDTIEGAASVRITSAGLYYLKYFINSFSYLDLAWNDTPFNDYATAHQLSRHMQSTDMTERFRRIESFLEYLDTEESTELEKCGLLDPRKHDFWGPFVPDIKHHYAKEKARISKKIGLRDGVG